MPARRITGDSAGWERVAETVAARRDALGLTAEDVVQKAGKGLSLSVLSLIENRRQDAYLARSITALCRSMGWTPNSIERILAGDEPVEVASSSGAEEMDLPALRRHVEGQDRRIDELERRLKEALELREAERREREGRPPA